MRLLNALLFLLFLTTPAGWAQEAGEEEPFRFQPDAEAYPDLAAVIAPTSADEFLAVHPSDLVFGDADAPVTVVEFFSYRCPFCKQFHEGTYAQVYADYIATGQVKFVKREFLLTRSYLGIEILAGAGSQCFETQGQAQAFAALMFQNQGQLDRTNPLEALTPLFSEVGLGADQARECMLNNRNLSLIFLRSAQAISLLGVSGTPTLFINGQRFEGEWGNFEEFEAALNAAAGKVLGKPA